MEDTIEGQTGAVNNWLNLNFKTILITVGLAYWLYTFLVGTKERKAQDAFGEKHGCLPMKTKIPSKWPMQLDLVKMTWDANADQRLLLGYTFLFEDLGVNLEMKLLGGTGFITIDPENLEVILSSKFQDFGFGSRRGAFLPLLGEGIFTQDGTPWKHSRGLLRKQFNRMQYQNLDKFTEHVDDLIAKIDRQGARDGKIVDLQPLFFQFTLDTTTALVFGESVNSLKDDKPEPFSLCFDEAQDITAQRNRLSDFYWAYTPPRYPKLCKKVTEYANEITRHALQSAEGENNDSISDKYAFIRDVYSDLKDLDLVRGQLVNVLLAGRDTTACMMSWAIRLMLRHPSTLERVKQEIQAVLQGKQELTREDIRKMPYLGFVLKETLRLYPSVPVNVRTAVNTTYIPRGGGPDGQSPVLLRKGVGMGYLPYHMHRRKDLYGEDAKEFRPERWEDGKLDNIGWGYLPFNGGPRICLGSDFAIMEASYAIARILQEYPNMKLPPGEKIEPVGTEKQIFTLVVYAADGCKVQLA